LELDEFPLYNWIKCQDGELIYCRREIGTNIEIELDVDAWNKLYDSYIKRFGLGKLYKRMLSVMKEKALIECDFTISRDRFKLTQIEIKEAELNSMLNNRGQGMTIEQTLIYLGKWLGYRLNPKEINVIEYYNILDEYGKANKKD
jgi:hypothetical protein